jgi:hypothetical protein
VLRSVLRRPARQSSRDGKRFPSCTFVPLVVQAFGTAPTCDELRRGSFTQQVGVGRVGVGLEGLYQGIALAMPTAREKRMAPLGADATAAQS